MTLPAPALGDEVEPAAEQATEPDLRQQATELAAAGRWAEAAEKFRAALATSDDAATRFNLAQAERNTGKLRSAQREFQRARDLARKSGNYDVQRLAEQALAALSTRVPTLVIDPPSDAKRVEARIDGERVDTGEAIALDPGRHDLVVTAAGREPFSRAIQLREGERLRVAVSFASRTPPARKPRTRPQSAHAPDDGPPIGALLLTGVGAAAFTSAALLHLRRNDKLDEAGSGCERSSGEFVCPAGRQSQANHRDAIDSAERAELARDVLLGVGVGAWSAAALWWLLDTPSERSPGASVALTPGGATARVRLRF